MPIYCLGSFFGETDTEKIGLITGKNSKSFFVEKDTEKSEINLQIVKIAVKKQKQQTKKSTGF